MAEIIETTVYQMEELSDDAKEKARDWYREGAFDHDWYWAVYADFEQICEILGIALASVPVRLHGGGTRRKPCIWFSGFASQGDGACFEGDYSYGRALLPIQPFVDGYDRAFALPMIAPLLSQPIVEFGLGVATWLWCEGGQDRALARRAFAEDLAPAVRDRRTKGRVESLIVPAFDANRAAIRRFLLDGWLADAGVLDCAAIDAELKRPADARDAIYIRLLQIVDIERWARSISGHPI